MRAPFKKGGVAFWHFPKDQIKTFELWWIIAETSASTTRISGIFEASDKKGSSLSFVWSFTESLPAAEQCWWAASSSSSCFIKTYSLFSSPPCFTPAAFIKEKKRPRSTSACLWSFYSKQVDQGRWCEVCFRCKCARKYIFLTWLRLIKWESLFVAWCRCVALLYNLFSNV